MTARNLVGSTIQLLVILLLIDSHGIESIGIAAIVNSVITIVFFLPVSVHRYRQTARVVGPAADSSG
jgi:hypothetical protein